MNEKLLQLTRQPKMLAGARSWPCGRAARSLFGTPIVKFDCECHGRLAAEQIAELSDGRPFTGTRIETGKRHALGWAQEAGRVSNGPFRGRVKSAPHLSG